MDYYGILDSFNKESFHSSSNDYWGIINVIFNKCCIILILWWNYWRILMKIFILWWVILEGNDKVVIKKLKNDVILLINDSLDDDFIIERVMKLIDLIIECMNCMKSLHTLMPIWNVIIVLKWNINWVLLLMKSRKNSSC